MAQELNTRISRLKDLIVRLIGLNWKILMGLARKVFRENNAHILDPSRQGRAGRVSYMRIEDSFLGLVMDH